MATKTKLQQQHREFLEARGWSEDATKRSSKYTVMSHPDRHFYYFLGSAGAVRRGRTVTSSISVKLLLTEEARTAAAQQRERYKQAQERLAGTAASLADQEGSRDVSEPTTTEGEQGADPTAAAASLPHSSQASVAATPAERSERPAT